jgi:hypothetical protein
LLVISAVWQHACPKNAFLSVAYEKQTSCALSHIEVIVFDNYNKGYETPSIAGEIR